MYRMPGDLEAARRRRKRKPVEPDVEEVDDTAAGFADRVMVPLDAGEIDLDGKSISLLPIHKRASLGLSYLPQEASVFRKLSVEQNIRAVLELQHEEDGKQDSPAVPGQPARRLRSRHEGPRRSPGHAYGCRQKPLLSASRRHQARHHKVAVCDEALDLPFV